MSHPPTWTVTGLLEYFREVDATDDRRFAFILGAGASVQSGIPMARQLVDRWLRELHGREDHQRRPLAAWATAETLGIPGFVYERAVESYSQVFARRFEARPDEGFAYLERILAGKDPSFGYSVLAQILAGTRHRVVITTNFDNLVADALAIYTDQLPFVCGHEALAGFVRANPRRPLVVKIHRDLLLAPKNRSDEISALADPLVGSLRTLLAGHTPIVLGYGGNDGSLMGLLGETLQPGDIPGGIYWTYYGRGGPPGQVIVDVVRRHGGALVPIEGFDEFMIQLNHALGYPRMDQRILKRAEERAQHYRKSFEELFQRFCQPAPAAELEDAVRQMADESLPPSSAARTLAPEPPPDDEPPPMGRGFTDNAPASEPANPPRTPSPVLSDRPNPTRSGGPAEPARAGRPAPPPLAATRSASTRRRPDDATPTAGEPLRVPATRDAPTAPEIDDTPSVRDILRIPAARDVQTQLHAATQALVRDDDDADWWTLKLQAEGEPSAQRRIAGYEAALVRFPDQPELLRGLAITLALTNASGQARQQYARLERLTPDDPQIHLDLAILYLYWGAGRSESEPRAATAWRLARAHRADVALLAAIAFVRGLLARLYDRDDTPALRVLRGLLPVSAAATLPLWPVLRSIALKRLDLPAHALYSRLLACLRGDADPSTLEAVERWTQLGPLAPEAAWSDEAPASATP